MTAAAFTLATILLKMVFHFLKQKTPEARKVYVKHMDSYIRAVIAGDAPSVNQHWMELREEARLADPDRFDPEKTS